MSLDGYNYGYILILYKVGVMLISLIPIEVKLEPAYYDLGS